MDKKLQAYYTNSDYITDYMINKLDVQHGDTVLEPSVGEGAFIKKIIKCNKDICIDVYDIDDYAISLVKQKYGTMDNVSIYKADTLFDKRLDLLCDNHDGYTKIIGNPPYGAYLSMDTRKLLKSKYSAIYAKETYVLFFYRGLKLLKTNGKMVFIIPDTFLFLNYHKKFRKYLFENFCVEEIAIFPSKLFYGVSFAYSNLSIITIKNDKKSVFKNKIKIYDKIKGEKQFDEIGKGLIKPKIISQKSVIENFNNTLYLNKKIAELINKSKTTLGGFG